MRSLTGIVKNYAWGSPTAIPAILGTVPDETPQAEYWLGAHDSAPAKVDGTTLDRLLADEPQLLGGPVNERFGGKLPFLMKILAAAQPLSLQAHPSAEQAEAGFAAEEARGVPVDDPKRTFKDTWPKPEVLVALSIVAIALMARRWPASVIPSAQWPCSTSCSRANPWNR